MGAWSSLEDFNIKREVALAVRTLNRSPSGGRVVGVLKSHDQPFGMRNRLTGINFFKNCACAYLVT